MKAKRETAPEQSATRCPSASCSGARWRKRGRQPAGNDALCAWGTGKGWGGRQRNTHRWHPGKPRGENLRLASPNAWMARSFCGLRSGELSVTARQKVRLIDFRRCSRRHLDYDRPVTVRDASVSPLVNSIPSYWFMPRRERTLDSRWSTGLPYDVRDGQNARHTARDSRF